MKEHELLKHLKQDDYHLDHLGRIVIDNEEILAIVNGALATSQLDQQLFNGGCSNSGC